MYDPGPCVYMEKIADVVARTMIIRHKERKFGPGCVDDWRDRHDELFAHFIGLMAPSETTLGERPFLFGDSPVYADFALLGVLENVTYEGINQLPDSLANIGRWMKELQAFRF